MLTASEDLLTNFDRFAALRPLAAELIAVAAHSYELKLIAVALLMR
jgi:hypothetical protein